jgi:hypothetical protein
MLVLQKMHGIGIPRKQEAKNARNRNSAQARGVPRKQERLIYHRGVSLAIMVEVSSFPNLQTDKQTNFQTSYAESEGL